MLCATSPQRQATVSRKRRSRVSGASCQFSIEPFETDWFSLGISQGGDDQEVFYAEVEDKDKIDDFVEFEDVRQVNPLLSL